MRRMQVLVALSRPLARDRCRFGFNCPEPSRCRLKGKRRAATGITYTLSQYRYTRHKLTVQEGASFLIQ